MLWLFEEGFDLSPICLLANEENELENPFEGMGDLVRERATYDWLFMF